MAKTLIVVDQAHSLPSIENTIEFSRYLAEFPKLHEPKTRIINLCDTDKYLSHGYYCSLLAEARQHPVMPSVSTINDLAEASNLEGQVIITLPIALTKSLKSTSHRISVYFGWTAIPAYQKLAKYLFAQYPTPILQANVFQRESNWYVSLETPCYQDLQSEELTIFIEQLKVFTQKIWRSHNRKAFRWDMAILVNSQEKTPPSDRLALNKFVKAAAQVGINAELVSAEHIGQLDRYDALFLRETTAIKSHTYKLARQAEQEGLVVIDDPQSILRCCNKVFLHDAFSYHGVPSPKTEFVSAANDTVINTIEKQFGYPVVLKLPESSFSLGVYKAQDRTELVNRLTQLLDESALVLVQEYLYTEFDWRIGVLNGRALYACRYHMARNHWQIYNHGAKRNVSGDFDTLPTFEVPRAVLNAATKACEFIGNGLYGVDIKQRGDDVFVIEVNDNPSIEHKVEDKYLGDELYMQIMQVFVERLEGRGK